MSGISQLEAAANSSVREGREGCKVEAGRIPVDQFRGDKSRALCLPVLRSRREGLVLAPAEIFIPVFIVRVCSPSRLVRLSFASLVSCPARIAPGAHA